MGRPSTWRARLRLLAVVVVIALNVTPLRNALMPACLWNSSWNDLSSLKLIRIHLTDLFFYIDRSPYKGSCARIHSRLKEPLKKLKMEELPAYSVEDFTAALDTIKWKFTQEELWKLQHFKPSLSTAEQRELLYSLLVMTTAFDLFNVTYVVAEGTLVGVHRHHGLIPWDDDVDVMVRADQWSRAREVLSCVPGFSLNMARDFMWKFMYNGSKLWRNEDFIRFPYIDIFPANEDSENVWPLTIWMKRDIVWRTEDVYPLQRLPLEGHAVTTVKDPAMVLARTYGPAVLEVCASRTYKRRERESFPEVDKVRVPCSSLYDVYPFVFPTQDPTTGETTVHVRKVGGRVLSVFKPGVASFAAAFSSSSNSNQPEVPVIRTVG